MSAARLRWQQRMWVGRQRVLDQQIDRLKQLMAEMDDLNDRAKRLLDREIVIVPDKKEQA